MAWKNRRAAALSVRVNLSDRCTDFPYYDFMIS